MSLKVRDPESGTLYEVASQPVIDTVLSSDSSNAIANRTVYSALKDSVAFTGTMAQWEALPLADKAKYKTVYLTDDPVGGDMYVEDAVTEDSTNPVTSGAVWAAIQEMGGGGMPQLDFANPIKTFTASDSYTVVGNDKWLYCAYFCVEDSGDAIIKIDGTEAVRSHRADIGSISNPIVHLAEGQVVTTDAKFNSASKVYILQEL